MITKALGKKSLLATALVSAMMAGTASAKVTDTDIANDQMTTNDVVTNGLGHRGQRFSPLDKLDTDTVKDLRPVWSFSFGGEKQRGQESQPLVKDGVMFVTGSYSRLFAIDAKTGDELWQYDARLPDG
ncbi:PQQ-binding-like beta-propeller repeat protein, partial [Oceanospirillum sp. HFRX-1_2]